MTDQLGPFQGSWEAWSEGGDEIRSKPLNTMRWLHYQPAEIARHRAEQRMRGRTSEILERYQRAYGI